MQVRIASERWRQKNLRRSDDINREYGARNRSQRLDTFRRNKSKTRDAIAARVFDFKNRPCMDCGCWFDAVCMDFDHRPGEVKLGTIARMVSETAPIERIIAEIAKCDVVCSNCHRVRTKNRFAQRKAESITQLDLALASKAG